MEKTMTLEVLSSIHGAEASEAVEQLFEVIKNSNTELRNVSEGASSVKVDSLRKDIVIQSTEEERNCILNNFPKSKEDFLVVAKVIEE